MPLDPNYVPLTPLWELHSNKDTGEFLRDGYALFYRDTARTVGKPVYQLTGSPPNYSYIQQGYLVTSGPFSGAWRVDLNDQGAFPLMVYGYPLDSNEDVDLYFIQFYGNDGVFQFSREGWPNFFASGGGNTTQINVNYIPNGQFLLHTDIPATDNLQEGEIRQAVTPVAYGGWSFVRPNSSTARDFVTFQRLGSYLTNPPKSPRYACRVKCENPSGGDLFKDLRARFDDVNKFEYLSQQFTFALSGQILSGGSINVSLILIKNFGTGGDAATETNITTFTLNGSFGLQFFAFDFGDNSGKVIGTNDDDYIELALRFPPNSIFDAEVTDIILTPGNVDSPIFDDTTTRQFIYRSLFKDMVPSHDGSDIGLPVVLGQDGLFFDNSQVGRIFASINRSVKFGELFADGSQYPTDGYSFDGIPYARLQKEVMQPNEIMPRYGTGRNFVTSYYSNAPNSAVNSLRIVNNSLGSVTDFSDGSIPTGFTFNNVTSGAVNDNSWGLVYGLNSFYIWGKNAGSLNGIGITPNTSGFTTSALRVGRPATESVNFRTIFSVTTIGASTLAGKYFVFNSTTNIYYVWYKVDGIGTDPALGGGEIGIQVDLLSTWTSYEVACATASAISGFKVTNIITTAGSSITPGSFFNLNAQSQQYYVWYQKDGAGTDPAPSGKLQIKVSILSTDTDVQVATKTLLAINSKYFATPDLRGMILKGWDNGAGIDLDASSRWSYYVNLLIGNDVGSNQFDEILNHFHGAQLFGQLQNTHNGVLANEISVSDFISDGVTVLATGGSESRPLNTYVNYVIKY